MSKKGERMGLLRWNRKEAIYEDSDNNIIEILTESLGKEDSVKLIAEAHAMDMIASTIANTEILTLEYNKEKKQVENVTNELYYLLNIKPNVFDNATNFMYKLVIKLLLHEEVLVFIKEKNGEKSLYLADSFDSTSNIMKRKIYKNVIISDNNNNQLTLYKELDSDSVIHICYKNTKINKAYNNYSDKTGKLLEVAIKAFKRANVGKYILEKPGEQPAIIDAGTGKSITYDAYKKKITDGLFSEDEAIIMLSKMFSLNKLDMGAKGASDIETIEKREYQATAMKYKIPLDIYMGTKTEKSQGSDDYITNAVMPYMNTIEDSYNDSFVGKKSYIEGERVKFNTFCMQYASITTLASSLEKLVGIGFSHNDICMFLSMPRVDEAWANEHNMTKNIGKIEGGENKNE